MLKQDIFDENQESICSHCESVIICCNSMTSTFICEGRFCEDAFESWSEEDEEYNRILRVNKLNKLI